MAIRDESCLYVYLVYSDCEMKAFCRDALCHLLQLYLGLLAEIPCVMCYSFKVMRPVCRKMPSDVYFSYEVMRFCWMEQSQRTKVDEVYKLLEQIASKAAEAGTGTAEDAFHQKWKHLVPNQRHPSVDSIDDRQGSVSSDDFNILVDDLSPPDSLENLAEPEVKPLPQAPPRRSKKKVSAPDITIPNAEEVFESSEATPKKTSDEATLKKTVDEQVVTPQIKDDTFPATMPPQQPQPSPPQEKEKDKKPSAEPTSLGSENDFTEFTSHDTADKSMGETPNMSQVTPDVFPSPSTAVESASEQDGGGIALEDPSQFGAGDGLPKVQAAVGEGSFVMSTPDKPQPKDRKTSTPFGKEEPSPSSSSTFSAGDSSSATFITAGTSSPGNLTEAYATASDSTILTDTTQTNVNASLDFSGFEEQPSITGDSSLSFEILDTTPVPSVFNDFNTSTDDSQNTPVSNPFATSATNPFTGGSDSIHKDDSFGEFTDGSLVGENGSIVSKEPQLSTPAADPKPSEDASSPEKNDFGIFVSDSSMTVTQNESSETSSGVETTPPESKPAAQEHPFDGFGTELSSLNSLSMPAASETAEPEQTFPSFTSDFSSLNSLSTGSAGTPQANAQSNPFVALEQATAPAPSTEAPAQSTEAQDPPPDLTGLGGLSFDILSSSDVTSTSPAADLQGQAKKDDVAESIQQASDLFGDLAFSNPPADQNQVDIQFTGLDLSASPEKENQGNTQQSLTDLFGLGSPAPDPQDSNAGDVVPKENSSMPGTSSSSSDFDFLSGFSSPPAASSNVSSNPFGGDGGLLQDFVGSSAASASASQVGDNVENSNARCNSQMESHGICTDTESTCSSEGSKEGISSVEMGVTDPPPQSMPSSTAIKDSAQAAPETSLPKNVEMARGSGNSVVSSSSEGPLPSLSEDSSAPAPSEAGSVDVRLEDVFEWDDFMGEPLVGKERTVSERDSPKQSFDMPDWTLDSDSVRSCSSVHSQQSDSLHRSSTGSDCQSTSSLETPIACSSVSDSEVTLHGRTRTPTSCISDLMVYQNKGLTLNTTSASSVHQRSLYALKLILSNNKFIPESVSQSMDDSSCVVPSPISEYQVPHLKGAVSVLHAEQHPPYLFCHEDSHSAHTNCQVYLMVTFVHSMSSFTVLKVCMHICNV